MVEIRQEEEKKTKSEQVLEIRMYQRNTSDVSVVSFLSFSRCWRGAWLQLEIRNSQLLFQRTFAMM
jgi:hypothetical protein